MFGKCPPENSLVFGGQFNIPGIFIYDAGNNAENSNGKTAVNIRTDHILKTGPLI